MMIYDYTEEVYMAYCLSVAEEIKEAASSGDESVNPEALRWAERWEFKPRPEIAD